MKQRSRYIILFCCTLFTILLMSFWGQINGPVTAQDSLLKSNTKAVSAIAYSQDGKNLVSGTEDGRVVVYDAATGKKKIAISATSAEVPITGLSFTKAGKLNTAGRDSVLRQLDLETSKQTYSLPGHEHPIKTLASSPDG